MTWANDCHCCCCCLGLYCVCSVPVLSLSLPLLQGNAHGILSGLWNSHVDLTPSNPDGTPAPGAEPKRLWTCAPKPKDDHYGCTHFAWKLADCSLLQGPPLPSDSRRRPDRHLLQERHMLAAGQQKSLIEDEQRIEKKVRAVLLYQLVPELAASVLST